MVRTREQKKTDQMAQNVSPVNKKKRNRKRPFKPHPLQGMPFFARNKPRNNSNWKPQRYYNNERSEQDRNDFLVMKCVICGKSTVIEKTAKTDYGSKMPMKCSDCEFSNKQNNFISVSSGHVDHQTAPTNRFEAHMPSRSNKKSNAAANQPDTSGNCLQWLLHPFPVKDFFRDYWEKKPLLVRRNNFKYYTRVLNMTTSTVDQVLSENAIFFTKHVDITSYTDGVRETHNPEGRALAHIVWDLYRNGCSVRFLNPQAFIPSIHKINSELQEKLGFVGCNLYLTPAGSQGFAPHYDDIEAFVLQIEGSKHWKVYPPLSESETLPRYSSKNLTEADLGPPIVDCVLKPGDLLFFPRGFVHQAKCTDEHSLHITLSAYQCTAYIDMFEKVLPNVLKEAASQSVRLRDGLPLNYAHTFGITRNKKYSDVRSIMTSKMKEMLHSVVENMDFDSAVDQFAASKLHDDLPLYLTEDVKNCTVFGNRNTIDPDGRVSKVVQLQLDSKVCLLQLNVCRLVQEGERYLLYHSMCNSLEYHERDREFLEVPKESVEAVRFLFHSYPKYVQVADLPISDDEGKWSFANTLWENGLLKTDGPLNKISPEEICGDDDNDDDEDNDEVGAGEA